MIARSQVLIRLILAFTSVLIAPAIADDKAVLDRAFGDAMSMFEQALPKLDKTESGVDTATYREAMSFMRFQSPLWGSEVVVEPVIRAEASGSCSRYAAFTRIPPENGVISLVLCPQFFRAGNDGLRALTVVHEMVHAVAGANECQAMAFAARVEQAAKGAFTAVDAYWQANGCDGSGYRLP